MQHSAPHPALTDSPEGYGFISRFNHWLIALVMIGMFISGMVMANGPFDREISGAIRDWHKPVGVLVLIYGVWRIVWRIAQGTPRDASVMPRWQVITATATHRGLLAMVVIMPLSGIFKSIYNGREVNTFGLVIPAQEKVKWIANLAGEVHEIAAWAFILLLVLHIGGALKHHFINRDPTLRRMAGKSG